MKEVFKDYRTYIILFLLVVAGVFIFLFYNTYAKYISSIDSDATADVASWKIYVNNNDVTSGNSFSNIITPTFEGTSNIASGVIAPTAEGYFDIEIDASDTDVSLKYTITTSPNQDSVVSDIIISGYSIDNGPRQSVTSGITSGTSMTSEVTSPTSSTSTNDNFKVEGNILYNSQDKDVTIRVYIKWNDDENLGASMTNSQDTAATQGQNNLAKINVNINLMQIAN